MAFAEQYRAAERAVGGCPLEWIEVGGYPQTVSRPTTPNAADSECEHGRLAGDTCPSPALTFLLPLNPREGERRKRTIVQNWPHDHPCGCHPSESTTPDLMTTLKRAEEAAEMPTEPVVAPVEAPYGYKPDGSPRKRPAPSADALQKSIATRRAKAAAKLAAPPEPQPDPDPPASDPIAGAVNALDDRIAGVEDECVSIDANLDQLTAQVRELEGQRTELDERREKLQAAKDTLRELIAA
jgi:outer membrane murein-binding lipoprotein Lpp